MILVAVCGHWLTQATFDRDAWRFVCQLVEQKFFRQDNMLTEWGVDCVNQAHLQLFKTRVDQIEELKNQLSLLGVSHLDLFYPVEEKRIWRGESVDTGLRLIGSQGRMLVLNIIPNSSAAQSGIKKGDEVISINGKALFYPWDAEDTSGVYTLRRDENEFSVELKAGQLQLDETPKLRSLESSIGHIIIPSFRGPLFEDWALLAHKLEPYKGIIVDLRDNNGGNFAAMLRVLSTFICQPEVVGHLRQPRKTNLKSASFPDLLNDLVQIQFMSEHGDVMLKTFGTYGCYTKPLVVLINEQTASVSEIFSQTLLEKRSNTKIMGQHSAGNVLLSVWYEIPFWADHSVSIPEAQYESLGGEFLEGAGVQPQNQLNYKYEDLVRGRDTWLETAIHFLHK